jgi:RNA polymerase sigma-70 factor, ECF subfamily
MPDSAEHITELLQSWGQGDERAINDLMPLVYDELHRMAYRFISGERPGHTLQATALVNEAYLRLVRTSRANWQNRAHFFAVSARVMRRILVDWARARQAEKRGSDPALITLDEALAVPANTGADLVAIDEALQTLARIDERKSRTVELRFFGGLSVQEIAEVLKVSEETVNRDWRFARTWLRRQLSREQAHGNRAVAQG